jgi:tRNA/tmRNA/rRNA uracil-C5-methylase (TrmA/RlmC/RlmD family)
VAVVRARVDDFLGVARPKRRGPGGQRLRKLPARHPLAPPRADRILLDPPRTGAGQLVVTALTALEPKAIVYVACDPAALARDTAYLGERGYDLVTLRAFDAFPMTHHVECVALFMPRSAQ